MSEVTGTELYDDDEEIIYHNELNNTLDSFESLDENSKIKPICSICYRGFNIFNRIPTIITVCGHSTCSECMDKIDNCPICRKEIDETIVNWAIYSELKTENNNVSIDPFYKIFIDFKTEIESDYLRYPDTPEDVDFEDLSTSQKKLINKLKFRTKDVKIKEHMFSNLLIPKWIVNHLKQSQNDIIGYKTRLNYFGLQNLATQLPFCP